MGAAFLGGVLIAAITSLPELITEISQALVGEPEIGVADDVGSNAFSVFLISLFALWFFKKSFLTELNLYSKLTMLASAILALLMGIFLIVNEDVVIGQKGIFAFGIIPCFFVVAYLIFAWIQFKYSTTDNAETILLPKFKNISLKKSILGFILFGSLIVIFSLIVNWIATSIILGVGLPEESVGGILLAITTSMPEIVVFLMFIKKKKFVTGIATLIGSHFFNLSLTFAGDLSYVHNSIFNIKKVGDNWLIAVTTGVALICLVIQSFFVKNSKTVYWNLLLPSIAISCYIAGWVWTLV